MYSEAITARDIADVERSLGRRLAWYTVEDCAAITAQIATAFAPDGTLLRPLEPEEQEFIDDTRLRCQFDARYFLDRFCFVRRDDVRGGEGLIELWGSQEIILQHIAYCEDKMWASFERQRAAGIEERFIRVDGICIALLKARQLGATVLVLLLLLHRFIFWSNLREVLASADATKTLEAFDLYWTFAFDRLPVWMKPVVDTKSKDFGMRCESLDTTLFLQNAAQESGIGMGGTSHCGLMTEVGLYPKSVTEQMQNHFFRSILWSLVTFIVMESLAQGQGNMWHSFSLAAIRGGEDAGRWHGIFIPWYAERGKYRREPPAGWQPSPETLKYAYQVYSTSSKYVGRFANGEWHGEQVTLDEFQLYFYESEKAKAEKDGALEDFLTNYPATPEEAFQSKSGAPFTPQVLQRLSNDCREPIKQLEWLEGTGDKQRGARPADLSIYPNDPRGVIRIYEKADKSATYKIGVDTAPGLDGWTRRMPQKGDRKIDNCAIEVVRIGRRGEPDVQVAEYIAPVNYVVAAPIANWLGRYFHGQNEEMCELVCETGPTSGEALQERLLNEYGYWNLYRKASMTSYRFATSYGWVPNEKSRLDLWYRTKPHISYSKAIKLGPAPRPGEPDERKEIVRVKFIARSRYLVDEEMRNCETDPKLMTAKAAFGFHDDALRALQLAIYIGHSWETLGEVSEADLGVPREEKPDYQRSDMTREEMIADVNARLDPEFSGEVY